MRRAGFYLLLACAVADVGCADSKRYADKDKLVQDYIADLRAGNAGGVLGLTYTTGLPAEDFQVTELWTRTTTESASRVLNDARNGEMRVEKIETIAPGLPGQPLTSIGGRMVGYQIPPTLSVGILFSNPTGRISYMEQLGIFERDGRYWICPFTYLNNAAKAPQAK